jgi:hypothetical protein
MLKLRYLTIQIARLDRPAIKSKYPADAAHGALLPFPNSQSVISDIQGRMAMRDACLARLLSDEVNGCGGQRINATVTPRRPRPSRSTIRNSATLQFEAIASRSVLSPSTEMVL